MKSKTILLVIIVGFLSLSAFNPYKYNHRYEEAPIDVEEWMTQPFTNFVEEPLEIEEWMTKPFVITKNN
ncbi:MAG TPA: hypothetical protein VMX17_13800 [Candidatus Glassbacteria bacterium]|nr:hypothetical protein [Candidatus Glassbacteria bacterium]